MQSSSSGSPRLRHYILNVMEEAQEPLTTRQIADRIPEEVSIVRSYLEEFISDSVRQIEPGRWALKTQVPQSPHQLIPEQVPIMAEVVQSQSAPDSSNWPPDSMPSSASRPQPTNSSNKDSIKTGSEFSFNFPNLLPASNESEFMLHKAALEWSLADPIVINSADDILSRVDWKDRVEPYLHQVQNLMTFCRRLPATIIADDVGLGKTISAGLIIAELIKRRRVDRVLVVCPAILCHQWVEELASKFNIHAVAARGSYLNSQIRGSIPVVVTTYHSISSRLEEISAGTFDMLILDEAHKLRNLHGTKNPPLVAKRFRAAMANRVFQYMLMLTATPIQNRIWDIYSLIDCLTAAKGHKNPLGLPKQFQNQYLANSTGRELVPNKKDSFRKIVSQYMRRTRRADAKLLFPSRSVELFRVVATPLDIRIQQIVAKHIVGLNGLVQSSLGVAMMSSPQAVLKQFRNMSHKDGRWNMVADEVERLLRSTSELTGKQQGLMHIVNELRELRGQDFRLVVFTVRKETQKLIGELMKNAGVTVGYIRGGQPDANFEAVKNFRSDPPKVSVIVSTDAGAEGINLQKCNCLVNYDLPWNPMIVEQRIGRIQRLASEHKNVVIQNLIIAGGPEEKIVARLMSKLQAIADTVGDIEGILESTNHGAKEDSGGSFESEIRRMVLESLKGVDPDEAVRLSEASIMQAKKMFDEQRGEIDRELGILDQGEDDIFTMPRLEKAKPSLSFGQFVRRSMDVSGAKVENDGSGILRAIWPDRPPERFTFDEEVWKKFSSTGSFHGQVPNLYRPGKPSFERLVQHWVDRAGSCIYSENSDGRSREDVARDFINRIDEARFVSMSERSRPGDFNGKAIVKAKVVNSIDSYEKLVEIQLGSGINGAVESGSELYAETISSRDLVAKNSAEIEQHASKDSALLAFREFYNKRLLSETKKAGKDAKAYERVSSDLMPIGYLEPVGIQGSFVEMTELTISYTIQGKGTYATEIVIDCKTNKLIEVPQFDECEISGNSVPTDCLGSCGFTHKTVMAHFLEACPSCGNVVLSDQLKTCEESGERACPNDMVQTHTDGKIVLATLAEKSAVSGRFALPSELEQCEFTDAKCLPDELRQSQITGKMYRIDQSLVSSASNRSGHVSEMVRSDFSGTTLSHDETIKSDVSGKVGFRDDFKISESGRNVHVSEYLMCAITNTPFPSDECATSLSGKVGKKSLMIRSQFSDQYCFPGETTKCEVTGEEIAAVEARQCSVSGKIVSPSVAATCDVSGKIALKKYMAPLVRDGGLALKSEIEVCQWLCGNISKREAATCSVTGARFHTSVMSGSMHEVINRVLQRKGNVGTEVMANIIRQAANGKLKRIMGVNYVKCESGKTIMVAVDIANLFGGVSKRAVLLLANSKTPKIYGKLGIFNVRRGGRIEFKEMIDL